MGLYTSAHYKNSPNDLQMLSDAPAHSVYCLLSPSAEQDSDSLPDVLAVVQVALEGKISRKSVEAQLARGHRSAGDLIPWTVAQQFGDSSFARLSGARVVRIATHPSLQGMGYGSRAVELLYRFFNGEMVNLNNGAGEGSENEGESDAASDDSSDDEDAGDRKKKKGIQGERLAPRKELPPLLLPLTEVEAPRLDWLGTSFGLTEGLHRFWTRSKMQMLYLRQTANELTGEHSAIMVRALPRRTGVDDAWLPAFVGDTKRRVLSLLSGPFRSMNVRLAMAVLENLNNGASPTDETALQKRTGSSTGKIGVDELNYFLTAHDMKRLELYGRNLCDHHLVTDLLPAVACLYFRGRFGSDFALSSVQAALLCGIGVQNRAVDSITTELSLPSNQVLAMFNKAVRKISIALNGIVEEHEKESMLGGDKRRKAEAAAHKMRNVSRKTLDEDAADAAKDAMNKLNASTKPMPSNVANDDDIMQYAIKGSDAQWSEALEDKEIDGAGMVSIKSTRPSKRRLEENDIAVEGETNPSKRRSKSKEGKKKKGKK